jgi:hypothetical protein
MRAGQAGTALGLGRLGRSSNCSSFIYHQGQGADRTYRAVLIGNHDPPLYWISHPPRVVSTPGTMPSYKPLMMHEKFAVEAGVSPATNAVATAQPARRGGRKLFGVVLTKAADL